MNGLMDVNEAAEKLGVSHQTLRRYANNNDIGYVRVGKFLKFSEKNLEDFIKKNTHPAIGARGRVA